MKKDVAVFVSMISTCQRVRGEHQWPGGLWEPLPIPQWIWEDITMEFVTGLPRLPKGHDTIWVVVDRLTKTVHF